MGSCLDGVARPFRWWLEVVLRAPRTVLAISVLLAIGAGLYTVTHLGFVADMTAVVGDDDSGDPYFQYLREFGQKTPMIVVVRDADTPRAQAFVRELTQAYRDSDDFAFTTPVFPDPSAVGLARTADPDELAAMLARLAPLREALAMPREPEATIAALRAIPAEDRTAEEAERLQLLSRAMEVVPVGQEVPRPLLVSDLLDPLALDLRAGRTDRVAAYEPLLRAWYADPSIPNVTASQDPSAVWSVSRFWDWARTGTPEPSRAAEGDRIALVVVEPYAADTQVAARRIGTDAGRGLGGEGAAIARFAQIHRQVKRDYPDIASGLTGQPLLNQQERAVQQESAVLSGSLSFVFVLIVVVIMIRRIRPTVAIGISLAVALAWTMAIVTATVGSLNVVSSAFAVVLCATGVDFGIHLATAFDHRRECGQARDTAIRGAFTAVGRGVIAGALTTALAFATTTVARFQAIEQLGVIAAFGMLLALIAMFTVLPALLTLWEPNRLSHRETVARGRSVIVQPGPSEAPRCDRTKPGTILSLLVLLAGGVGATVAATGVEPVGFDGNRLALLDPSVPAVPWLQVMDRHSDQSSRFGIVLTDSAEDAARAAEGLRARPDLVKEVVWLGDLVPPGSDRRKALLEEHASVGRSLRVAREAIFRPDIALQEMRRPTMSMSRDGEGTMQFHGPAGEPLSQAEHEQVRRRLGLLMQVLEEMIDSGQLDRALTDFLAAAQALPVKGRASIAPMIALAEGWRDEIVLPRGQLAGPDRIARMRTANLVSSDWQTLLVGEFATLEAMAEELPTTPEGLPDRVRSMFLSPAGTYLVQAFAVEDVWEEAAADRFVSFGRSVDPQFTGPTARYFYSIGLMRDGLLHAGILALVAIFMLLCLDFLPGLWVLIPLGLLTAGGIGAATMTAVPWYEFALPVLGATVVLSLVLTAGRLYPVLLAMVPLVVAVGLTHGTMVLLGIPFNPANIVIVPALIGIGIDIGIHLAHQARRCEGEVRILAPAGRGRLCHYAMVAMTLRSRDACRDAVLTPTAKAVVITSLTTMVGFGGLIMAGHVGMRTLGMLFVIAIGWSLLAAFTVLPAITRLLPIPRRLRSDEHRDNPDGPACE